MLILGLSSFKHDTAAAILEDGVVKAAVENDKLLRSGGAGLPEAAISFCLEKVGAAWGDLEAIAVATHPLDGWRRRSMVRLRLSPFSPVAAAYREANELGAFARERSHLRSLRLRRGDASKVHNFDHHLCHAANAFYLSPFERALVLTLDEEGDGTSGTVAIGDGSGLQRLHAIPFPHSLGWVYSQVTRLLGFTPQHDEHKTQWLSLEGEPSARQVFLSMLRDSSSVLPRLNYVYVNRGPAGRLSFSARFYRELGLADEKSPLSEEQRRQLASSLQSACVELIGDMVEDLRRKHGIEQVCLGGGLFLNTLLVSSLERRLGLGSLFVPPAPGNSGNAVGAAMLAWHDTMKKPRVAPPAHVYWGPGPSRSEIKDVLDNCKARYSLHTTEDRRIETALQLLQNGKIVGWYQGATEFGPRALGHRSLLASPWAAYVRENLNDYIKHREWFRPFALSVPEEDCARYFEASALCRVMNSLAVALEAADVLPEGFLLPGRMVRLHVVQREANPQLWRLLKRFGEQAPAPVLVNTSFNLFGEPLVVRPRDAVRSYFCSGIDALIIDNFVLSKTALSHFTGAVPSTTAVRAS